LIRLSLALGGLALSCCLLACPDSREAKVAGSAGQVARAIELVRNADNDAKRAPLAALGKVACGSPEVCAVRDVCVEAYKLHVDAVEMTQLAKEAAANGKTPRATLLLIEAQKKLSLSGPPVANCVEREGELRRRFKL
jgi:hypothetical protein